MEIFVQKYLYRLKPFSGSIRPSFFILSGLAIFCLLANMPFWGFACSGLSLVLFLLLPIKTTQDQPAAELTRIPTIALKSQPTSNIGSAEIQSLVEGTLFSQLREYLNLLYNASASRDAHLSEVNQLAQKNINQLNAELFLLHATHQFNQCSILELSLLYAEQKVKLSAPIRLGNQLPYSNHWQFAWRAFGYWAVLNEINPVIEVVETGGAWCCRVQLLSLDNSIVSRYSGPMLSYFLNLLAEFYDGEFSWDILGQSFTLLIPMQQSEVA